MLRQNTTTGTEDQSPFRSIHQPEINLDVRTPSKSRLPPRSELRSPFERTRTLVVPGAGNTYENTSKGEFPITNITGSFLNSTSKRDTSPKMLEYKSQRNNDSEVENASKFDSKYNGKST